MTKLKFETFLLKKIYLYIICFIVLQFQYTNAQISKTIEITGNVDQSISGKAKLLPFYLDNGYYVELDYIKEVNISNGKFSFKIKCDKWKPFPLRLVINDTISTNRFYLCGNDVDIKIKSLSNFTIPILSNECEEINSDRSKFKQKYSAISEFFDRKTDSLHNTNKDKLSEENLVLLKKFENQFLESSYDLLQEFIFRNKNSYFAFWQLTTFFAKYGYHKRQELCFNEFSDDIKMSNPGKLLLVNLRRGSKLSVGSNFSNVDLKNHKLVNQNLSISDLNKKYVLVDFWFSSCAPCLENFKKIQEVYKKFKSKDFEIVAISKDNTENIQKWLKIIEKKKLNWLNFLDENGKFTESNLINAFPTNFLVDDKGVILFKDITSTELETFLSINLK